jgi:hypothetical protein
MDKEGRRGFCTHWQIVLVQGRHSARDLEELPISRDTVQPIRSRMNCGYFVELLWWLVVLVSIAGNESAEVRFPRNVSGRVRSHICINRNAKPQDTGFRVGAAA